jgi:hypothetical protein
MAHPRFQSLKMLPPKPDAARQKRVFRVLVYASVVGILVQVVSVIKDPGKAGSLIISLSTFFAFCSFDTGLRDGERKMIFSFLGIVCAFIGSRLALH